MGIGVIASLYHAGLRPDRGARGADEVPREHRRGDDGERALAALPAHEAADPEERAVDGSPAEEPRARRRAPPPSRSPPTTRSPATSTSAGGRRAPCRHRSPGGTSTPPPPC